MQLRKQVERVSEALHNQFYQRHRWVYGNLHEFRRRKKQPELRFWQNYNDRNANKVFADHSDRHIYN